MINRANNSAQKLVEKPQFVCSDNGQQFTAARPNSATMRKQVSQEKKPGLFNRMFGNISKNRQKKRQNKAR